MAGDGRRDVRGRRKQKENKRKSEKEKRKEKKRKEKRWGSFCFVLASNDNRPRGGRGDARTEPAR
jgi:hypothetical protein